MTEATTYTEAQQSLASVLDQAAAEGEVRIKRQDGRMFVIRPLEPGRSPLDVEGIDLHLTVDEILQFIAEGRRKADL